MNEVHWHITCKDGKLLINKLNAFFTAQQALSRELQEAKPLGTCRITTSKGRKHVFRSLDSMLENGRNSIRTVITHTNVSQKEML